MTPHHWQGIVTRYVGPTDHKPARIIARSAFHRITINWDDEFGIYENHESAARSLSYKMGQGRPSVVCGPEWEFVGAESPSRDGYVFIMLEAPSAIVGCVQAKRCNAETAALTESKSVP